MPYVFLDASVKLLPHDWIGVVANGNLFLWRYMQAKDAKVNKSYRILSSYKYLCKVKLFLFLSTQAGALPTCRQFELPSSAVDESASVISLSCFEADGRPRLCAIASLSGILRVWPRGVFGAVGRSQVVHDYIDTRLNMLKNGEVCVTMEEGPCVSTFPPYF